MITTIAAGVAALLFGYCWGFQSGVSRSFKATHHPAICGRCMHDLDRCNCRQAAEILDGLRQQNQENN